MLRIQAAGTAGGRVRPEQWGGWISCDRAVIAIENVRLFKRGLARGGTVGEPLRRSNGRMSA